MSNTSIIPVSVDGVRLDTLAYNVEGLSGRLAMPGKRGENAVMPGMHGRSFMPKRFDSVSYTLRMWVIGSDEDGNAPDTMANEYQGFRDNLDTLNQMFGVTHRPLDVRQTWPDGVRQAFMDCLQVVDPEIFGVRPTGKFAVALENLGFWQDVDTQDYTSGGALVSGTELALGQFLGSTAPMMDYIYVVKGPANNPLLKDPDTGHWIKLNKNLAAGEHWRLDAGNATSVTGVGIGFAGAGASAIALTQYAGLHAPAMMGLTPRRLAAPHLTFEATGGTGAGTAVDVRGRRKYLS